MSAISLCDAYFGEGVWVQNIKRVSCLEHLNNFCGPMLSKVNSKKENFINCRFPENQKTREHFNLIASHLPI